MSTHPSSALMESPRKPRSVELTTATTGNRIRRFRCRPTAIIAVVCSAAAFALALVLVLAGTRPGMGNDLYLVSLNTSRVGTETIQFTPVDSTSSGGVPGGLGPLGDLFGGIIGGLTDTLDTQLENLEKEIVSGVVDALGVKDEYNLFLRELCEGTLANEDDPSSVKITTCSGYNDLKQGFNNITNSIPSSIVVATTNISVPILSSLSTSFGSLQDVAVSAATVDCAFLMIGMISSALVLALSIVAVVVRPNLLVGITLGLAATATTGLFVSAFVTTILGVFVVSMVNGFGDALTISAKTGTKFLVLVWISFALSVLSFVYWFAIWFVETRTNAFQRRKRTEDEIGNWRGIWREVKSDLRTAKKEQ